eukprot:65946_1
MPRISETSISLYGQDLYDPNTPSQYVEYIRKRDTIRHNDDKRIETKYDAIRKANKDKKSSESPLVVGMEVLYNHSLAFVGTKKKLKCEVDWSIFYPYITTIALPRLCLEM